MKIVSTREAPALAGWTNQLGRPVDPALQPGEAWILAVDETDGRPRAALRWRPALGLSVPRPHFHVGRVVHASPELRLFQALGTLQLGHDLTGQAELADLALAPGADPHLLDTLVAEALAGAAGRQVVVELQGDRDAAGRSPFWQGLGRHFYGGDPDAACERFGDGWLAQLAGLLPRQTIYLSFLSAQAQQALGRPGPAAQPALAALTRLGWAPDSHVRVDDGGPVWVWRA